MPVTVSEIRLPEVAGGSDGLTGVLAVPEGPGRWPGVVLVHEAYGITDVMRRQVARIAEAGYLALMPDLFAQGGARRCLVATFRALRTGEGRAFVDIDTARNVLAARPDSTGRVGVLGFCMGGGFALVAASGHDFAAASVNYGMLPRELDEAIEHACPIVGSYGGRDRSLAGAAARLETVLTAHGIAHDVKEYPDAGHSFLNDAESGPFAVRLLTKPILGAGPNPEAAADAWHRIEAFFGEHLGRAARSDGSA
ncbi:dienelactone hydrolase family protein [Lysinimonas soli]|uniref:Dienelactone hydrolase family protein n=1 Tax=Lysinimonas soli TaxID=1074233 RepID=A0ABW0NM15_9MICO